MVENKWFGIFVHIELYVLSQVEEDWSITELD